MVKLSFILSILLSFSAQAHQYIQCWDKVTDSPDRLVISLDKSRNTFFLSAEVNSDDPVNSGVLELTPGPLVEKYQIYSTQTEWATINVYIPSEIIGKASRNFELNVEGVLSSGVKDFDRSYSCYSAIYE